MSQFRTAGTILVLLCVALRAVGGQETPPRDPPVAGGVEELDLPTIYLKDAKGNLVPVPGMTFERLRELLLHEARTSTDPPPFAIERLAIQGQVEGLIAQLEVEATIQVRKSGWVVVPLRFPKAVLRGPVVAEAEDEIVHRYDGKEGHLVWLNGKQPKHTLRLPLTARLQQAVEERQLQLPLPKASEVRLTIDVPGSIAEPMLRSGDGLVDSAEKEGRTQLTVTGADGDLNLAWRPALKDRGSRLDIDATADVAVRFETRDSVTYSARMQVARLGASLRRVLVRLPPQAELVSRTGRGFTAEIATEEDLAAVGIEPKNGKGAVRVELEQPAETVDFVLEATHKSDGNKSPLEVAGFEVLGAGRQSGFASVYLPSGWSLKATPSAAVMQIEDVPPLAGQARASARYRFVRQPFSLKIDAAPQPPRTVVEPTFFALVEPRHVTLSATLEYQTRGPRPEHLEINPGDWILDAAGPSNLVEMPETVPGTPVKLLLLPGAGNEFAVQLQLHRELPEDSADINFGLPLALATQRLPSTLVVSAAENVALTPVNDAIRSLIPDSRAMPNLPAVGQRPLVYRELPALSEPATFAAGMQVRKRRVSAAVEGRAQLRERRADVVQSISLDIAYEPLGSLVLEAAADASLTSLAVSQEDELLDVREAALADVPGAAPLRRWHVELPKPAVGKRQLTVRYLVDLPNAGHVDLPLVVPAETDGVTVARQQLEVQSSESRRFALAAKPAEASATLTENEQGLTVSWLSRMTTVELERASARAMLGEAQRVQRQWLQSWLGPAVRRDRFVARIAGVHDQLSLTLPTGVSADELRVLVDGAPPRAINLSGKMLLVNVEPKPRQACTLELWYLLPGFSPQLGPERRTLEMPRVGNSAPLQSWVQILTPGSDQVLFSPSAVTPQHAWRKRGLLWQRSGALSARQLEDWVGASQSEDMPFDTNDALYMTLGPLASLDVVVWGRRWLWTFVAGGVLFVGAMVHFLSRGRSVLVVAALATATMLAALLAPELALNISQFVGVGVLLLVAVAWSLRVTGGNLAPSPVRPVASPRRSDSQVVRRESSITGSIHVASGASTESRP